MTTDTSGSCASPVIYLTSDNVRLSEGRSRAFGDRQNGIRSQWNELGRAANDPIPLVELSELTRLRLGPPRSVVELVVLAVSGSGEVVLSGSRWRGVPL